MSSILPIFRSNEQFDYLKRGYYNNFMWSLSYSRDKLLLPFIINGSKYSINASGTISNFELRKIDPANPTTILKTNVLATSLITVLATFAYNDYVYYANDNTIASYDDGIYQYYVKDSNNNEFYSGFFCHKEVSTTDGDFNEDFNEDFYLYDVGEMDLVKLEVYNLTGIYPDDFTDKVYLPLRLIAEGKEIINNNTSEAYGSIYDNIIEKRLIQSVVYNRYETTILLSESQNYENINAAKDVRITDTTGYIYIVNITEPIERESVEENNLNSIFSLKFRDVNTANYQNGSQPIVNHYSSDSIKLVNPGALINNAWSLKLQANSSLGSYWDGISSGDIFTLYGGLTPKTLTKNSDYTTPNQGGEILIQSQTERRVKVLLYLTETQTRDLQTYIKKVDKIYLLRGTGYNNLDYTANVELSVDEGSLYGLYKCELEFTYDIIIKSFVSSNLTDYKGKLTVNGHDYLTNVLPFVSSKPIELIGEEMLGDGSNTIASYIKKQTFVCKFFLTGTDLNTLISDLPNAQAGDSSITIDGLGTYNSDEMIKLDYSKVSAFKDLHEVDINFTILVDKTYNYS